MFELEDLQALNDWQIGGRSSEKMARVNSFVRAARNFPEAFRRCEATCYRQLALNPRHVRLLGSKYGLAETVSSWTIAEDVAKTFAGGVPPIGYQGVIFSVDATNSAVVLNLAALYADEEFLNAIDKAKGRIRGFGDGIGAYW